MVMVAHIANGQISVDASGYVKLVNKLDVTRYNNVTLYVQPDVNNTGYIGTTTKQFYEMNAKYHRATGVLLTSDKRFKDNFRSIDQPLQKILKLNGTKYDFKADASDSIGNAEEKLKRDGLRKDHLGFIAQEVKEILPEAVVYDKDNDKYFMDYNAIIPVIVEAMKEQQKKIDDLTDEINKLKSTPKEKSSSFLTDDEPATLNQNIPNPFSSKTRIEMVVPSSVSRAILYIYNMQGEQVKQMVINERGNSSVTIEGHTLKAGMYLYTLITDGKEVDTKKMILTK
jgi:hypothetical protein